MHHDNPSAVRRARRLAHGKAVGKRIKISERRRRVARLAHAEGEQREAGSVGMLYRSCSGGHSVLLLTL